MASELNDYKVCFLYRYILMLSRVFFTLFPSDYILYIFMVIHKLDSCKDIKKHVSIFTLKAMLLR